MRPEDAITAAAAEGLTLVRKDSVTGYLGVSVAGKRFKASIRAGKLGHFNLGQFDCPEEAALAIARKFPRLLIDRAEACAAAEEATMTAEQAQQTSEAEGLTLFLDPLSKTGYRGVRKGTSTKRPYDARLPGQKDARYVGVFASPHEAALAIARRLGPTQSAARAQQQRNSAGWLMTDASELTAQEARKLAEQEGLALRRSHGQPGKYWSVYAATNAVSDRWIASVHVGPDPPITASNHAGGAAEGAATSGMCDPITSRSLGRTYRTSGRLHLGSFASAEGAALAIAKKLRDDPPLAAHVQQLQLQNVKQQALRTGPQGKRQRTADAPSWLLPGDRPAWRDEVCDKNGRGCQSDGDGADNGGDDNNAGEEEEAVATAAIEVDALEVEVWSDDDDEAALVVEAELVSE